MISQSETRTYACRACGSERLRKNGRNRRGAQRGQCLECGRTLVLEPAPPPYSPAERERILHAATAERLSLRGVTRTFGPCYQTLLRWAEKKGSGAARLSRHAGSGAKGRRA